MDEDFLLENDFAKKLYHDYAKDQPIIDYHCHLSPHDIQKDRIFKNITEIWLHGDHYKWRAMRTLGIQEQFITGSGSDWEKFEAWAETVPYTMRNPLFHWTHTELKRYFGIADLLAPQNARAIYEQTSELTNSQEFSTRHLLAKMKVETVCTTDDPVDDLQSHIEFKKENNAMGLFPAFRPDKAYALENPSSYREYLKKLGEMASLDITNFDQLVEALSKRIDYFHFHGCRMSDHGLEQLYHFSQHPNSPDAILKEVLKGNAPNKEDLHYFKYSLLLELCKLYHAKGWTQQFHLGALRNNNSRMLKALGPDTGFDSIGDFGQAAALSRFLDELDREDQLSQTILYNINPRDNEVISTMVGNFNDGSVKGKIQFGSGWWFLDQKDGMEKQLNALSNMGLVSCFVGMLTDSRSFLSFPRHEYFRRILCNLFGKDVANGELPADEKWIGQIIADISYHNAKNYFLF